MSQPSPWPRAEIRRSAATFNRVRSALKKLFDGTKPEMYRVCLQIRMSDPDWLLLDLRDRDTLGRYGDASQTNWLFSGKSYAALTSRSRSLKAVNLKGEARSELRDLLDAVKETYTW